MNYTQKENTLSLAIKKKKRKGNKMSKDLVKLQKEIEETYSKAHNDLLLEFGKICYQNKIGILIKTESFFNDEGGIDNNFNYKYVKLNDTKNKFSIHSYYETYDCFVDSYCDDEEAITNDPNHLAQKFMSDNNYDIYFSEADILKFGAEFEYDNYQLMLITFDENGCPSNSGNLFLEEYEDEEDGEDEEDNE